MAAGHSDRRDRRASAVAATCDKLLAVGGENQSGQAGQPLPRPFEVVAVDAGGNVCAELDVTFTLTEGGGSFAGESELTVTTNADGRAGGVLQLGLVPGINNHVVTTSFPGLEGAGATFVASTVAAGAEAETEFVGVVLDTENEPVPNAHVSLAETDPLVEAFTDEEGRFTLAGAPIGSALLEVDGSTTTREGSWPTLEFQVDLVAGVENSLGRPIFLPELDADGFRTVGGSEDVELTMDGVEGFSLTVFADSVTFPDGSTVSEVGVTQVSNDQVPMPPNGGAAPPWVGTLQPAGVTFDPPVRLTVPNSLGLPPGQIVDLFSFDHDLHRDRRRSLAGGVAGR